MSTNSLWLLAVTSSNFLGTFFKLSSPPCGIKFKGWKSLEVLHRLSKVLISLTEIGLPIPLLRIALLRLIILLDNIFVCYEQIERFGKTFILQKSKSQVWRKTVSKLCLLLLWITGHRCQIPKIWKVFGNATYLQGREILLLQ